MAKKKRRDLKYEDYYDDERQLKVDAAREFLLGEVPYIVDKLARRARDMDSLIDMLKDDDTVVHVIWNALVLGTMGSLILSSVQAIQALKQGSEKSVGKTLEEARGHNARDGIKGMRESLQKFMNALDAADKGIADGADVDEAVEGAFTKHVFDEIAKEDAEEDEEVLELDDEIDDLFKDLEGNGEEDF